MTPENPGRSTKTPGELLPWQVETVPDSALEAAYDALMKLATAYFKNPSPELFEACEAARALVSAAKKVG